MIKDLIQYMLSVTAITTVCGTRIYPVDRPQGSDLPAITVMRVSGGPVYGDDGESGNENGRVQLRMWGTSYAAAKDLAIAVKTALSGLVDVTQGSTTFIQILVDVIRDEPRQSGSNQDEYLFSVTLDLLIWI